ncbi:mas-related G-protein coupled receptor member H-like [Varanus komodoensis]|uniref:mas-related G-protein coupled receptor member H-like n=1 Tax=Varanus komodoensis TaxID=61221 RepID=UPI001CF77053|nr:mas-related G-protein coupled receptor member H-like [Varanus komodoensis]
MTSNLSATYQTPELNFTDYNDTDQQYNLVQVASKQSIYLLFCVLMVIICILGLVGNGIVIRLLGFHIKRNPFTTYILNLAVADFGVLLDLFPLVIHEIASMLIKKQLFHLFIIPFHLFLMMYLAGQLLLTAISMDRCVTVLFPIWHRCHRPPRLSTTVCVLIWVLCFLLSGVHMILQMMTMTEILGYLFLAIALLCLPLITVSSLILFIKICFKSQQQRRGKLLTAILFLLFFFLILAFPLSAIWIMLSVFHFFFLSADIVLHACLVCACLNSSINPLIYFLMAHKKRGQSRQSMKVAMQRVFREEENPQEQLELSTQT